MILDPLINNPVVLTEVFAASYLNNWAPMFSLNTTTVAQAQNHNVDADINLI